MENPTTAAKAEEMRVDAGGNVVAVVNIAMSDDSTDPATIVGRQRVTLTISNAAKELSSSTRDFIWTLDPDQNTLYDVVIYLKDFGDETFDKTGVDFRVNGINKEIESIKLPVVWRRHLILLFKESMNNVLKHSECKNVTFNISLNQNILQMTLIDDGIGQKNEKSSYGNGLKNMKNRADLIKGKLNILFEENNGTTIQFIGEIP